MNTGSRKLESIYLLLKRKLKSDLISLKMPTVKTAMSHHALQFGRQKTKDLTAGYGKMTNPGSM